MDEGSAGDWPLPENRHHGEGSESNKLEFTDIPEEDYCMRFGLGRSQCYMAYVTSPHSTGTPVDSSLITTKDKWNFLRNMTNI
jgi:hypothetical protein